MPDDKSRHERLAERIGVFHDAQIISDQDSEWLFSMLENGDYDAVTQFLGVDAEAAETPDVLLDPPAKYDRIRNEPGVCGDKPNLYYNGTVHRIWVTHAVDGVEACGGIEEYVDAYGCAWGYENKFTARDEMREAVEQAIAFHDEYDDVFELVRHQRDAIIGNYERRKRQ